MVTNKIPKPIVFPKYSDMVWVRPYKRKASNKPRVKKITHNSKYKEKELIKYKKYKK